MAGPKLSGCNESFKAAEKWFNKTSNDTERAELEKGISAIIYRGCMIAAKRSYDTIVIEKKEESRRVILDIYNKTKQMYTLNEIKTLAAKNGVNCNIVADINQSLVDDELVHKEKVGIFYYYRLFPAKKDRVLHLQHEQTLRHIEKYKRKIAKASVSLADAKRERAKKIARLAELTKERQVAQEELDSVKENKDPQVSLDLKKELDFVKQAANRWTDNVINCKSYLVKERRVDKRDAMKILEITSAFDYPEDKIPK